MGYDAALRRYLPSLPNSNSARNHRELEGMRSIEALLSELDRLIVEAEDRFGKTNPVLYQYQQLRAAVFLQEALEHNILRSRSTKQTLREIARLTFGVTTVSFGDPLELQESAPCFSFPQEAFSIEYQQALERFRDAISVELTFDTNYQNLLNRFIYVIGPELQWRQCMTQQSITDIFLGNKTQKNAPFHPVLAHDFKLLVACAGEVAFYWKNQEKHPEIVMINNVSGHYRPILCSSQLEALTRTTLKLPRETSVLALANDGFRVSGPIARALTRESSQ
jgi:hypothetical protein